MEKYNNILTTSTSILLSFDLRKSEVEEREKRTKCWCLLLVSNDIDHHGNFKRRSHVVKIVNHASRCCAQSRITRLIWAKSNITQIISVPSRVKENPFATPQNGQVVRALEILIQRRRLQATALTATRPRICSIVASSPPWACL